MWPFSKKKDLDSLGKYFEADRLKRILINGLGIDDIRLNDTLYVGLPKNEFINLAWSGKDTYEDYRPEICDCDDMALFFTADTRKQWVKKSKEKKYPLAFGRAKVKQKQDSDTPHVLIWQVDDKGNINWFEPQTYTEVKAPFKIYNLED